MIDKKKPLCVTVFVDKQARQILELVFRGPGRGEFILVEHDQTADICIFDLDGLHASDLWKDYRIRYPDLPTIILSLAYKEIAGTWLVRKPIQVEELLKNLRKVKHFLEEPERSIVKSSLPKQDTSDSSGNKSALASNFAPTFSSEKSQEKTPTSNSASSASTIELNPMDEEEEVLSGFCGHSPDIDPTNPEEYQKIYYSPSKYLQGVFEKAYAICRQLDQGSVFLEGLRSPVLMSPSQNQVFCNSSLKDNNLRTMAFLPLATESISIQILNDLKTKAYLEKHTLISQPLDRFLWKIALWTARGRIPEGTDLYKTIVLLHWPNFTRLEVTPHALEIAALWMVKEHSLLDTAKILQIPQRYVFSFYSATSAVKLAFVDRRINQRPSAPIPSTQKSPDANEKRTLLQRILVHTRSWLK
jgi:hypothetical protein